MINFERIAEINKNVSWTLINQEECRSDIHSLLEVVQFKLGLIFQPIMDCIIHYTRRHSADLMYDVNRLLKTAQEYDDDVIDEGQHELMLIGVREFGIDDERSIAYAMSPDSCLGDVNTRYKGLFRLTFEKCGNEFTFYLWEGKYSPVKVTKEIS